MMPSSTLARTAGGRPFSMGDNGILQGRNPDLDPMEGAFVVRARITNHQAP